MSLVLSEIPVLSNVELPEPITIAFIVIFILIGAVGGCILRIDEGVLFDRKFSTENIRMLKSALEEISANHASSIADLIQRVAELEEKSNQYSEAIRMENKKLVRINTRITKFVTKFESDMQKVTHKMSLFEDDFDDFTELREQFEDEMCKIKRLEQFQDNTQQIIQMIDEKVGNMMLKIVQSDARYANRFALIEDDISKFQNNTQQIIDEKVGNVRYANRYDIESLRTEINSCRGIQEKNENDIALHKHLLICLAHMQQNSIVALQAYLSYNKPQRSLDMFNGLLFHLLDVNKLIIPIPIHNDNTKTTTKLAYDYAQKFRKLDIVIECRQCDRGRAGNPCECVTQFKTIESEKIKQETYLF